MLFDINFDDLNVIYNIVPEVDENGENAIKIGCSHFCLRQHFHDYRKKEENDCSIEVECAKEKNCLLKKWENLERDDDQYAGEGSCNSLG